MKGETMEIGKILAGAREINSFMDDKLALYNPAERMASLRAAADAIQQTLMAESMKAVLHESLRRIFVPSGPEGS